MCKSALKYRSSFHFTAKNRNNSANVLAKRFLSRDNFIYDILVMGYLTLSISVCDTSHI